MEGFIFDGEEKSIAHHTLLNDLSVHFCRKKSELTMDGNKSV